MHDELLKALEAIIYVVGEEGITIEDCSRCLEVTVTETQALIEELMLMFQNNKHGIELVKYGDYYKFVTKIEIAPYLKRLITLGENQKISSASLETLAIIAYKQPITRLEIEEIRGVNCDLILRKLLNRGLIEDQGRSDAVGRPILYGVTNVFLDAFKLVDLSELPELENQEETLESVDLYEK